jgi:hypothetical protein
MYTINYIEDFHGKNGIQQDKESFYQQTGITFKEETNYVLHLEHSFFVVPQFGHFRR